MNASVTRVLMETLAALDEEIAAAKATITKLTLERQGVEAALKRFGDTSTTTPAALGPAADEEAVSPSEGPKEPTDNSGLTSRVSVLLRDAGRPLNIGEIAEALDLDVSQARSAVGYLKRKGEARNVQRGLWTSAAPTDTDAVSVSAETASDPIPSIMEGGGASGTDLDGDHDESSSWRADHRDHPHGAPVGAHN